MSSIDPGSEIATLYFEVDLFDVFMSLLSTYGGKTVINQDSDNERDFQ